MEYLLERLGEASTWRGLIMLLTAFGVGISPELSNAIIASGMALVGVVGAVTKG